RTLRGERRDEVREATAEARDGDLAGLERGRARDDGGVVEVALPEAALEAAEALAVHLARRAHAAQALGEAEAVLVDGLVDDREAGGLREGDDERLMPVGHEAGVDVGLENDRAQLAARVVEADAVVLDLELAADLPERVEERDHLRL